jgi:vancomycin aglycone glucosyltransferase
MLLLAAELRRRGHDVLVVAHPDHRYLAEPLGVPFHAVGEPARGIVTRNARRSGDSFQIEGGLGAVNRYLDAQFEGFLPAAEGADLILASGLNASAGTVGQAVGATVRWMVMWPWMLPSPDNTPVFVRGRPLPRPVNAMLWPAFDLALTAAASPAVNAWRRKLGLTPQLVQSPWRESAEPHILACDRLLAPIGGSLQRRVVQTAAILPRAPGELPDEVTRFLEAGDPPVFLGFGSTCVQDRDTTTRMLLRAVKLAGVRAIVARGWAGIAAGDMPEGVLSVGELPFGALFPRMSVVVHHGGSGTTATAARAGVPQIITPQVLDQFRWGARVFELGIGPRPLPMRTLSSERLSEAIRQAVDSHDMRARARVVAAELADADGIGLTADAVEARPAQRATPTPRSHRGSDPGIQWIHGNSSRDRRR